MKKFNQLLLIALTLLPIGLSLPIGNAQAAQVLNCDADDQWNYSIGKIIMSPISTQISNAQNSPEPPEQLVRIAETIKLPSGYQSGLTITSEGNWALLVRVPSGTLTPIATIESLVADYPIVYQILSQQLPVARPAYPNLGE